MNKTSLMLRNKQKGFAPILIVILIALAVGGYLLYQKQSKLTSVSQPSPSPVTSPVASNSAETANWKTYIYDSAEGKLLPKVNPPALPQQPIKYSVNYPSNWTVSTTTDTGVDFGQLWLKPPASETVISISVMLLKTNGFNLDQIIDNDRKYLEDAKQESITLPIGKTISLSGVMNKLNQTDDIGKVWQIIYFKKDTLVLRAFLLEVKGEKYSDTFDQILSTFKFIQ